MKYNKSEIMKDAWRRYKTIPAKRTSFGFCLHLAWVAAKEENDMDKLPALTGSEKQVEWAEKIRAAQIAWVAKENVHYKKQIDKCVGREDDSAKKWVESRQTRINKNNAALAWLLENATRAGWWLDNSSRYSLYNPDKPNFRWWDDLVCERAKNPEMKTFRFAPWTHGMK